MDYDRYDATLHYIFKQTQGDAWFRPHEDQVPPGVCLRTHDGQFRVFPYETAALAPFEAAVSSLNPQVAVKVRSAAVHAALSEQSLEPDYIYVDANTRIQVLDSMFLLPQAEKDQNAAFIRDERVLVVWSDSLDTIIPIARDFEDRLIRLLWRTQPPLSSTHDLSFSSPLSVSTHSNSEKPDNRRTPDSLVNSQNPPQKRTWYGRLVPSTKDPEKVLQKKHTRPIMLFAPLYNGLSAGLALGLSSSLISFIHSSQSTCSLHGQRFEHPPCRIPPRRQIHPFRSLRSHAPPLLCLFGTHLLFASSSSHSQPFQFFTLQIFQNITFVIGPIAHYHKNSRYYSAIPPPPNPAIDNALPHITIQMPVYKESLTAVLSVVHSIQSFLSNPLPVSPPLLPSKPPCRPTHVTAALQIFSSTTTASVSYIPTKQSKGSSITPHMASVGSQGQGMVIKVSVLSHPFRLCLIKPRLRTRRSLQKGL